MYHISFLNCMVYINIQMKYFHLVVEDLKLQITTYLHLSLVLFDFILYIFLYLPKQCQMQKVQHTKSTQLVLLLEPSLLLSVLFI